MILTRGIDLKHPRDIKTLQEGVEEKVVLMTCHLPAMCIIGDDNMASEGRTPGGTAIRWLFYMLESLICKSDT